MRAEERDAHLSRKAAHLEADCIRLFSARSRSPGALPPAELPAVPPAVDAPAEGGAHDASSAGAAAGGAVSPSAGESFESSATSVGLEGGGGRRGGGVAQGKRLKVQRKPGSGLWLDAWTRYLNTQPYTLHPVPETLDSQP